MWPRNWGWGEKVSGRVGEGGVYERCGIASDMHKKEEMEHRSAEGLNQALGRKACRMVWLEVMGFKRNLEKIGKMGWVR